MRPTGLNNIDVTSQDVSLHATPAPQVVVLIVGYNHHDDLIRCLTSIDQADDGSISYRVVVVDNASEDDTDAMIQADFPHVQLICSEENLGFAGGNNLGWANIAQTYRDLPYLMLLNPDTTVSPGWLVELVTMLEQQQDVAIVQPKIRLMGEDQAAEPRINTAGNESHFLGFGFVTGYGQADRGQYDQQRDIHFASGAAQMIRCSLLREHGLFDAFMFMYLEDAELSWKMRHQGYRISYQPRSVVYHRHDPARTLQFLYELEKNRWWLLLTYYRWRTLILIGPAWDMTELFLLCYAAGTGRLREKLRAIGYFFRGETIDQWISKRALVQHRRVVSDHQFLNSHAGSINFPPLNRGLIRWLANPLLAAYWAVVRRLIWW